MRMVLGSLYTALFLCSKWGCRMINRRQHCKTFFVKLLFNLLLDLHKYGNFFIGITYLRILTFISSFFLSEPGAFTKLLRMSELLASSNKVLTDRVENFLDIELAIVFTPTCPLKRQKSFQLFCSYTDHWRWTSNLEPIFHVDNLDNHLPLQWWKRTSQLLPPGFNNSSSFLEMTLRWL